MTTNSSAFDLSESHAAKASTTLIGADEQHFASVGESLAASVSDLSDRLDQVRRSPGGGGQDALERDLEIHRLTARLATMRRFGLDLCLGRMVADGTEPVYVGRIGLTDSTGRRLLVDWRSPAAEPSFGATHANPMGLTSRRRYRWTRGRITDYWDEVFTAEGLADTAALDDQSAFIASLGSSRSARMRDVLGTIQSDQDAIIRASAQGALVVDGGPGTGKTVVALHRTAYLLYSDPRISRSGNGVLFIGPSQGYLAYVDDVLPSLGENSVQIATLADLVPEGTKAAPEVDPEVAVLKDSARLVQAIDAAVALYERPPARGTTVETAWADIWISPDDWAEAFEAADASATHNEAREQVWEALLDILIDKAGETPDEQPDEFDAYGLGRESSGGDLRETLETDAEFVRAFGRAWPLLEATDLVSRLWSRPAFLQASAPWLSNAEVETLQRADARAWTSSDLPLLDAAQQRLGDPEGARIRRRQQASAAAERARMADVIDSLIATDDSDLGLMKMLRGQDLRSTLVDSDALPSLTPDQLAGPFSHIVIDEAQELTDAAWQMLRRRCPSGSFTIVGDRAQARHGFTESWEERLERVGIGRSTVASLSINYRTPSEVMAEAEPVIRAVLPDANVPTSVRTSGVPVRHGLRSDLGSIVDRWLADHEEGLACVIGDAQFEALPRVRSLTAVESKGLEFDLVVLIDPDQFATGIEGAVDYYVAMTRATQQLVILRS